MRRLAVALVALVIWLTAVVALVAITPIDALSTAHADTGDVQPMQDLDKKFTTLVEQIPGMHIINAKITDQGGRKVCAYLNTHNRKDTDDALRQDNPTFTPAEADAFVDDATEVYCRRWIRQVIA